MPLVGISAALYELGDYEACIHTATKAIELLKADSEDEAESNIQKLNQRIEKATVHVYEVSEGEKRQVRHTLLGAVPRYRPSMLGASEYFTVGHDVVTSLFGDDGIFEKYSPQSKTVSFFFGGVGDARNMYQTISVINELELSGKLPRRRYHFTLNDIHKAALARDLIICILLDDLSKLDENSDESLMILNTIFFIFVSTMMPKYAFDHLNLIIDRAVRSLRLGHQPLGWLYLHETDIPSYLAALNHWKKEASNVLVNSRIMRRVSIAMARKLQSGFSDPTMRPSQTEELLYDEAALLLPSQKVMHRHDPIMLQLIEKHASRHDQNFEVFRQHVETYWHWNTTLMDQDLYDHTVESPHDQFDVGFNPFEEYNHFPYDEVSTKPKKSGRLFEHLAPFFADAAKALKQLGERLQVEAALGDYTVVAERLQYGLYEGQGAKEIRPEHFPRLYDRVHLSNVP
ncbi:hypothetical protein EG329_013460 [Mollisiaceae sp. DMI_Dod_QoI]|nr:hypothetical protein EG329_013460 [Helotiales sp. DMI_Dod_QoI]